MLGAAYPRVATIVSHEYGVSLVIPACSIVVPIVSPGSAVVTIVTYIASVVHSVSESGRRGVGSFRFVAIVILSGRITRIRWKALRSTISLQRWFVFYESAFLTKYERGTDDKYWLEFSVHHR